MSDNFVIWLFIVLLSEFDRSLCKDAVFLVMFMEYILGSLLKLWLLLYYNLANVTLLKVVLDLLGQMRFALSLIAHYNFH